MNNAARPLLAGFMALALAGQAPAAAAPSDIAAENAPIDLVSSLIVHAATPGPAWWRVTKGNSTVWVFGTVPYLSDNLNWDKRALRARLRGSKALLVQPILMPQPTPVNPDGSAVARIDPRGAPGLTVADLPPDLRTALGAAMLEYGGQHTVPDSWSVVYATRMLNQAVLARAKVNVYVLPGQLNQEGHSAHIRISSSPVDLRSAATAYVNGALEPQIVCLRSTLAAADQGPAAIKAGMNGWADGDLGTALAQIGCVGPKAADYRREVQATLIAVRRYLSTPGKAVVTMDLVPLLMTDGLIQQLKTAGYRVEGPEMDEGE